LTAAPVNTRALSFLSCVAGDALTRHLSKILPALLTSLASKRDTPNEQQVSIHSSRFVQLKNVKCKNDYSVQNDK